MKNRVAVVFVLIFNGNTISVLIEKADIEEGSTVNHLSNIIQNINNEYANESQCIVRVSFQKKRYVGWSEVGSWDRTLSEQGGVITGCTYSEDKGVYRFVVTEKKQQNKSLNRKLIHMFDCSFLRKRA